VSVNGLGPKGGQPAVDPWEFWEYPAADGARSKLAAAWESFVGGQPGASTGS
jgi:hypothetical protein